MDPGKIRALEELAASAFAAVPEAQRQVIQFQQSADSIPLCQMLLEHATTPQGLLFAAQSLLQLITTFIVKARASVSYLRQLSLCHLQFQPQQTVDIRNYLLNLLAQRPTLPPPVPDTLIKVIVRLTKLGYELDQSHRDVVQGAIVRFLQHTVKHCILGLNMLVALLDELAHPVGPESWAKHRTVAQSFRDRNLLFVFQLAITTLK